MMSVKKAAGTVGLLATSVLLATPAFATDGYFMGGFGAKAKGAGGVAIALPQEATAIASNPALAMALGQQVSVDLDIFVPDRHAMIYGNQIGLNGRYDGNGSNPFLLGDAAYTRPVSDRLAVGIAVVSNGGADTLYRDNPYRAVGGIGSVGLDLKQLFVMPTVAARIAPGQNIGISAVGVVQRFRAQGIGALAFASSDPSHFSDQGNDWSGGVGVRIGYYGQFGPVSLGAFVQPKIAMSRFDLYSGLFVGHGKFDVPTSYGVGAALRVDNQLTVAVDYRRIDYADVPSLGNDANALSQGKLFGADDGPGFSWHDVDNYKAGIVYRATDAVTLRAGYARSTDPVPRSATLLNIVSPGVVRDHFTLGASLRINPRLDLSFDAMRAPRVTDRGSNSIPVSFGSGNADISLAETSIGFGASIRL